MQITVDSPHYPGNYAPGYAAWTVTHGNFISQGIRWFTRWDALLKLPIPSHAFIITGQDSTVEAFPDGVHPGTLSAYLNDPEVALLVRKPFGWTPEMGAAIVAAANQRIGEHYGYSLIVGMAIANSFLGRGLDWITRGHFGNWVEGVFENSHQEICSEMQGDALRSIPSLATRGCLQTPSYTLAPVDTFVDQFVFEPDCIELVPAGSSIPG